MGTEASLPAGPDGSWLASDARLDGAAAEDADGDNEARTVFAAFSKWGPDLPGHLHGDFALALWQPRERKLTLARDIMAVRPLCYFHRPGRVFGFASLPKGLHASGIAPRRLDLIQLGQAQLRLYVWGGHTGFEGIEWLAGGHSLVATPEGIRVQRAWRPEAGLVGSWRGTPDDAAAELRRLIENSVAVRIGGQGRVAAHLSGGLDSSAVAIIAARRLQKQGRGLLAFSQLARPEPPVEDEREYVNAVLSQEPGIRWAPSHLPPLDIESIEDPDIPLGGAQAASEAEICDCASQGGAHILLSGAGGDEGATYNGSNLYAALLRGGKWRQALRESGARARIDRRPLVREVLARLILPLLPEAVLDLRRRQVNQSVGGDRESRALRFLNPKFGAEVRQAMPESFAWNNSAGSRIHVLTDSYLDARANRWSIIGARYGISFSYPLVDRQVLDFCLSLPIERLLDGGYSRQPFRNAMAGILPESIRWRTSKFSPFPDLPLNLAASAGGLGRRVEKLRGTAAADLFALDAMSDAFREAASQTSGIDGLAAVGRRRHPLWVSHGLHAHRALILAEHVVRYL
jgi:asparagine synthase (glutamine-hydrolysing)